MVIEQFNKKLKDCLKSRWSVIFIESFDFSAVTEELWSVIENEKLEEIFPVGSIGEWNPGYEKTIFRGGNNYATESTLEDTIRDFIDEKKAGMLVLKNIHNFLQNDVVCSLLQEFVFRNDKKHNEERSIIVIMDAVYQLPIELEKLFYRLTYPYPDREDIKKTLEKEEYFKNSSTSEKEQIQQSCVDALVGMQMYEIRTLLKTTIDEKIDEEDIKRFQAYKKQIIKNSGILEVVESDVSLDKIVIPKNLKEYLRRKKIILEERDKRNEYKLPAPKGILLVGPPGCGKTITAKAIAAEFEVPLLRLDMGRLMGSYVGESERNLAKAIAVAEAAQPCVLWIDEIEKAFAGSRGESGTNSEIVRRMVGSFLTWLQERESEVFIAATANDKDSLPPELTRKGRLDEEFSIDYPNKEERKEIFKTSLEKCGFQGLSDSDLNYFSDEKFDTEKRYSGAVINAIVQTACECFIINELQSNANGKSSIIQEVTKVESSTELKSVDNDIKLISYSKSWKEIIFPYHFNTTNVQKDCSIEKIIELAGKVYHDKYVLDYIVGNLTPGDFDKPSIWGITEEILKQYQQRVFCLSSESVDSLSRKIGKAIIDWTSNK